MTMFICLSGSKLYVLILKQFETKAYTKLLMSVHYNLGDLCWGLLLEYTKEYSLENKKSHKLLWHTETIIWQG